MQQTALTALAGLVRNWAEVYITPQNLYEFWVVATRPVERNGLGMTAPEAEAELARLEQEFSLLPDVPAVYREWRRLVFTHNVIGVRAHDARLVASMAAYGITHLLTFNVGDFSRFQEITVVDPRSMFE